MNIRLRRRAVLLAAVVCYQGFVAGQAARPTPPVAPREEHTQVWHGRNRERPVLLAAREGQPRGGEVPGGGERLHRGDDRAASKPFREALYKEMLGRIKQTDLSVPTRDGRLLLLPPHGRGPAVPDPLPQAGGGRTAPSAQTRPEQVLLDQNEMAKGLKFLSLGAFEVSDDGNLLAYSTDTTGFRQYTLYVKDLRTGAAPSGRLAERVTSVDVGGRQPDALLRDRGPGHEAAEHAVAPRRSGPTPVKVYEEKDELFSIGVGRTKDKKFVVLGSRSTDTWENRWLLSAATPDGALQGSCCRARRATSTTSSTATALFYIRTNKGAKNFRLVTAPLADPVAGQLEGVRRRTGRTCCSRTSRSSRTSSCVQEKQRGPQPAPRHDFADGAWTRGRRSPSPSTPPSRPARRSSTRSHLPLQLPEPGHARRASTTTTWRPAQRTLLKRRRCSAATTRSATSPSGSGPPRATA